MSGASTLKGSWRRAQGGAGGARPGRRLSAAARTLYATLLLATLASFLLPVATAFYGDQIPNGTGELLTPVKQAGTVAEIDGVRWDSGSTDDPFDDVVVLDLDRSASISLFDVVLADGSGTHAPGHIVHVSDTLLLGRTGAIQLAAVYCDRPESNETGFYSAGDLVYITTGGTGNLPATSASAVSIRMTNSSYGRPGSLVRTADPERILVAPAVTTDFGSGPGNGSIAYYEVDGSNRYEGQNNETLYLAPSNVTTGGLRPFTIRLYGPLPPPPSQATTTPPPANSTTSTTTPPPIESTTSSTTQDSTSDSLSTPPEDDSPAPPSDDNRFAPTAWAPLAIAVAVWAARRRL